MRVAVPWPRDQFPTIRNGRLPSSSSAEASPGIGAAQKLKKNNVEVVVVDKNDYHTFQPLLYQVATGLLEQPAVGHPIRDLFHDQDNARIHRTWSRPST